MRSRADRAPEQSLSLIHIYATLDAQYEKEQSERTAESSVLEKAGKSYEKHEKDADRFIALIDKYENFDRERDWTSNCRRSS